MSAAGFCAGNFFAEGGVRALLFKLLALPGLLPVRLRRFCGRRLGLLVMLLARRRKNIAARNLQLALPSHSAAQRQAILRLHFMRLGESFLDECWLLSAGDDALRRFAPLENGNLLSSTRGAVLLMPHFAGMHIAGVAINLAARGRLMALYRPLHSSFWNEFYRRLRGKYQPLLVPASGKNALRQSINHLRGGGKLLYLPDIDPKQRKSTVFAPFMGVAQTATYGNIGRLARAGNADVLPCLTGFAADGYRVRIMPSLPGFSGRDPQEDAAALNRFIGEHAARAPECYYWLHRRFKTRPPGQPYLY